MSESLEIGPVERRDQDAANEDVGSCGSPEPPPEAIQNRASNRSCSRELS